MSTWRKYHAPLIIATLAVLILPGCSMEQPGPKQANVVQEAPQASPKIPDDEPVARVASQVEPSVVQVNIQAIQRTPFGPQNQEGLGSGVIYRKDGYIITNNHVVQGASEVNIAFADGRTARAEVIGGDPRTDLAVVRANRRDLPAAKFSSESPVVGQLAVAVGSPSGFESTVTAGVVSGLNREISPQFTGGGFQDPSLTDLIQTDAAISPGSSGGALASRDGEIIGINVAYLPQTQTGRPIEGIGFAIPATTATSVADQIIETGEVTEPFVGIVPVDISSADAERFGISGVEGGGAGVAEVTQGTPADRAGLREGDVIVGLGGDSIESTGDLYAALRDHRPGDTIEITIVRNSERRTLDLTLAERPEQQ